MECRQNRQNIFNRYHPQLEVQQQSTVQLTSKLHARNIEMEEYNLLQDELAQLIQQYNFLQKQVVIMKVKV
jgi:hypothetical protein